VAKKRFFTAEGAETAEEGKKAAQDRKNQAW
jgi:hypothetical protein